jgi:hypothetical protein
MSPLSIVGDGDTEERKVGRRGDLAPEWGPRVGFFFEFKVGRQRGDD